MARYRHTTILPHSLRVGDEIRAADGESWLPPLTQIDRKLASERFGADWLILGWTRPHPSRLNPDLTFPGWQKLKIRRLRP